MTRPTTMADASDDILMVCPRCANVGEGYAGCPRCANDGVYVNFGFPLSDLSDRDLAGFPGGPWGWRDTLPLLPSTPMVSLGEGNTRCIPFEVDGSPRIWLKNEGSNPTWSHKDRGMSVAVAKAVEVGAKTVVAASSGNAGLAAAAYAARAGLRAVILAVSGIPPAFRSLLATMGARLVLLESDVARYEMARATVEELGWYPVTFVDPRVGGNPYGNTGYKSIAYELARDFGDELSAVVIPTSRADLFSGVARGFEELVEAGHLLRVPHLVAAEAETGAAFSAALDLDDPDEQDRVVVERLDSPAFSIGSERAHWQGLWAIRISRGWAVAVDQETYLAEQSLVGKDLGLVIESSAAVSVAAARAVSREVDGVTVAVSTSAGFKDPVVLSKSPESPPVFTADLDRLAEYVEGTGR